MECEVWDSGIVVECIGGTFDLVVFKLILGSFSALVSNLPICRVHFSQCHKYYMYYDKYTDGKSSKLESCSHYSCLPYRSTS